MNNHSIRLQKESNGELLGRRNSGTPFRIAKSMGYSNAQSEADNLMRQMSVGEVLNEASDRRKRNIALVPVVSDQ